jgi:fatty-acid desaturase
VPENQTHRWRWDYVWTLVVFHAVACLAVAPWLFSWTGVLTAVAGLYVFGTLGINLCFHRLLTHRGLVLPLWLEHAFATLGVLSMQDTPARWVAVHRIHHQHSDAAEDPHSPRHSAFWGHMGWLLAHDEALHHVSQYGTHARDVLRDPYYLGLERRRSWLALNLLSWALFVAFGCAVAYLEGGRTAAALLQRGASVLVWGVFVRTVLVWHITWSVNSLSHLWGYRTYDTPEHSRNNWFVALVSNGEGWHNNHHGDPRSARHGHRWWELDVTWLTIRALEMTGLATRVIRPRTGPHGCSP